MKLPTWATKPTNTTYGYVCLPVLLTYDCKVISLQEWAFEFTDFNYKDSIMFSIADNMYSLLDCYNECGRLATIIFEKDSQSTIKGVISIMGIPNLAKEPMIDGKYYKYINPMYRKQIIRFLGFTKDDLDSVQTICNGIYNLIDNYTTSYKYHMVTTQSNLNIIDLEAVI